MHKDTILKTEKTPTGHTVQIVHQLRHTWPQEGYKVVTTDPHGVTVGRGFAATLESANLLFDYRVGTHSKNSPCADPPGTI